MSLLAEETFARALACARRYRTQREIGQLFGVSATQVARWERGISLPAAGAMMCATAILWTLPRDDT